MQNKYKFDHVTGSKRQSLLLILFAAVTFFGGFSFFLSTFPFFSVVYMTMSIILGSTGIILMVWLNYFPNLWVKGLLYLILMFQLMFFAIRSYSYMFPAYEWIWAIAISASVMLSYLIPIINSTITRFLRNELTSPQTSLGKKIYALAIFLGPAAGIIGAIIGMGYARERNVYSIAAIMGSLLWAIAIFLPFGSSYPVSPFEKKR